MSKIECNRISNGIFKIQNETIYAPTVNVALNRYWDNFPLDIHFSKWMNTRLKICRVNDVSIVSHSEHLMEIHNPRNYNHELKKEKQRESNDKFKENKLNKILERI